MNIAGSQIIAPNNGSRVITADNAGCIFARDVVKLMPPL